ncbi:MAG: Druantia anti-phage system protein DruA [Candidatus Peribacteraceae bacterium]
MKKRSPKQSEPFEQKSGALEIKVAHSAQDWRRAKEALGREHGLGAGSEAGDRLCQLVMEEGKLAGVLVWCAAAWHLKDRDEAVGWDAVTRSERLKLVVQLRRFLVLEESRRPNLASQCLGAGMRELGAQWESEHGYRPLLAESFSDPESHAGTVYKATNWTQAGTTKGFSQDHSDYYIPNGRPKKLWLKALVPKAYELMSARELPEACKGALVGRGGARSALKNAGLKSLRDALLEVPDPRHPKSRRHPLPAMLALISLGLLMGARDVLDIWRKVACLSQSQREAIGLRVRDKQSRRLKMPGYDALNDLLAAVEPSAYARALTVWLQANAGVLPRSLALDGKSVGDGRCGMIITLCRHEDGRPVAMIPASGKKEDCEVSEARSLLADQQVELVNALVTADPLHNKEATVRVILEKGGDYLIGTKENTSKRLEGATRALDGSPFFT